MITLTWGIGPDVHGSEDFEDEGLAMEEETRLRAAGFATSIRYGFPLGTPEIPMVRANCRCAESKEQSK